MKLDLDNRQSDVQIEILPMIDVIFCILTFFILAAVGLTRQQAIALDLPAVNNSSPVEGNGRKRIYVSVDEAGQVYVDKDAVSLSLLYDVLLQHQQFEPDGAIILYASRNARYEDVIKVLDLLRTVGGDRVALATLPTDASLDPTQGNSRSLDDLLGGQEIPGQEIPGQELPGQELPSSPAPGLPDGSEFGSPQIPSGSDPSGLEGLPPIDSAPPAAPSPLSPAPSSP